ncbi:MAG: two-component regulator propeller domain-containing protein [Bacteroidales bacterium]|nr:two-component regulator propeller domain-containing protein [Bacteroidales bacterium]
MLSLEKHCCLFLLFSLLLCIDGNSQSFHFRHLTIEDGLSQSTINCMFQDKKGYMWFGTQDGLNKYDGYKFEILRNDPSDTNSISHSWIWDVFEDSHSYLWIATWNGLTKYDPRNDKFTRFFQDENNSQSIQGDRPTSICEDEEGNIWIGTWGGGLNCYNPQTGIFTHFRMKKGDSVGIADDFIRKIFIDSQGKLWIGTWNGLSRLKKENDGEYNIQNFRHNTDDPNSLSSNQITCITEDKQGHLWFGTFGGGLNKLDPATNKFRHYKHNDREPGSLSSNDISMLLIDRKSNLWVGTISEGLNLFINTDESFLRILNNSDDESSLIGDNVYSIYEDNSGLLWIGAGGLNIYNRDQNQFKHFVHNPNNQNSLSNNKVTSFEEDSNGDIWIGTETGGLNHFDPIRNIFTSFSYQNNQNSISSNNISAVVEDDYGNLWISTRGGGINKYNPTSKSFSQYLEHGLIPESEGMNYVNGIRFDSLGALWLATYNKGLIKYDVLNNLYSKYTSSVDPKSISGDYLLRIYIDSQNRVWIGSWGAGLSLYNREKKSFTRFLHNQDVPESICGNIIHTIYETSIGNAKTLWVGTSSGLSYMNISDSISNSFDHLFIKDGLPSNVIYGILDDNAGNLWISTNYGICKYNPKTNLFKNYDYKDGLQSNEFNAGASFKLKNGELLFGGINGFNSFLPDSIKESDYSPNIVFTAFNIFDQPQNVNQFVDTTQAIKLAFKDNFFSFEFAALDFSQPANNKYKYFMEGVDKEWIDAGTRRYVSYTNIDPGSYTFRVKGTNSDGVWSSNEASLKITITPPYWQKIWFQILFVLVFLLTLYAIHRYRLNRLLEIERLRIRIASDLHDEIGSALTRIAIHSEQIQSSKDDNRIHTSSRKIGVISREVISTMSDIVWSIDARNDSLNDLLDRIYDFTHNTLAVQDVKVSFSQRGLDKSKKIKINFRQNIYYILKEAINNIVKHASATEVNIVILNDEKNFTMQISDNGIGFDPTQKRTGNGLKNMQMRAKRIGGELSMDTDKGTNIKLIMKRL